MVSIALPTLRVLASTLGLLALIALSVILLVRILPIPESPLFLGASVAVVYWILKAYTATDDD